MLTWDENRDDSGDDDGYNGNGDDSVGNSGDGDCLWW